MMMRRLFVCFVLAAILAVPERGAGQSLPPSPMAKQLKIGCYTYGGSDIWTNSTIRDWYARRYNFLIGSGTNAKSLVQGMRTVNPALEALIYDLYVLQAVDTVVVKQWALSKGYDFESMILRVKNNSPADSVRVRVNDISSTGFGRFVTTRPGGILLSSGYTDAQTRFCWDFRNPKVGEYLGERWRALAQSYGYDGVFVDEESIIGHSYNNPAGIYPPVFPFIDLDLSIWAYGSPYSSLVKSWGSSFDIPQTRLGDANTTHSYVDIRDSLRLARSGWMKTAGDIMKNAGLYYAPNFAAVPVNALNNWLNEGVAAAAYAGSYVMGEYSYISPSAAGQEDECLTAMSACSSIRDSAVNIYLGWVRMGQFEQAAGVSYDRSKMNALGYWLACLFPGRANYFFSPSVKNGQVDFLMRRDINGIIADDTTTMWANAWGKYFGVPTITRDSSTRGTDPAGQSYTIHKVSLMHPTSPATVQTQAIGRFARGTNLSTSTTAVNVSLGGAYFELLANGKYGPPTTSTSIANAQWRIYVADTTLANTGQSTTVVTCTGGSTTCVGSTGNLNCLNDDEVDLLDLVLLLDYLFMSNQTPCCSREADVDGNGQIEINDLTELVSFLFLSGPALPACPASLPN